MTLLDRILDIRVLVVVVLVGIVGLFLVLNEDGGPTDGTQVPPAGFSVTPAGDEVNRLSPIRVSFENPPDERDASKLLSLEPEIDGEYVWQDERTLLFQPEFPGLLRGFAYTVHVPARPEAGLPQDFSATFRTAGVLEVANVIPAPNDVEVPEGVQVLVQFTRSVVPLTVLSEQPDSDVLVFDPPLAGNGEWLNTSLYRFVPEAGAIEPNTTYDVTVPAGLTHQPDGVLDDDYTWSFTTYGPALVRATPGRDTEFVGLAQAVELVFNQPMDHAAVEAGFTVIRGTATNVPGSFHWSPDSTVATFQPSGGLLHSTSYRATLAAGLAGINGGVTAREEVIVFRTVGLPTVTRTFPANGSTTAERYGVNFEFSNPMDEASFEGRVSVSSFDKEDIQFYVYPDGLGMSLNVPLEASTPYTVTLEEGITDRYGQPLPPYTLSFTTGRRQPQVTYASPNEVATYSASTEPLLYFHAINLDEVRFTLYPLTRAEMQEIQRRGYIETGQTPFRPSQPAIATWTETTGSALNEVLLLSTSLSRDGGPLPKGDYLVRTNPTWRSEIAFSVVDTALVLKETYDELLVWAVDLDTGDPVTNLALTASGTGLAPTAGTTDADGLASFPIPGIRERQSQQPGYLIETTGGERYAVAHSRWQYGSYVWDLGLPIEQYPRAYVGHLYTERPIYRLGEEVLYKGVLRADDDAVYSVPENLQDVKLTITDAEGKELVSQPVTLNDFGTFASSFVLPADGPTGDYGVQVTYKTTDVFRGTYDEYITGTSFLVAEFRRPEFEVTASTVQPGYVSGETIEADFEATYYFGGGVAGATVDWTALSFPTSVFFEDYAGYSFSDFDYYLQSTFFEQPVRGNGTAVTGDDGIARVEVPAVIQGNEGTQRYEISASVIDATGQAVGTSAGVLVHPADAYAGIRTTEYIATTGTESAIEVVSVDTEGNPLANRDVRVLVYEREWITTKEQTAEGGRRYRSEPRDTLVDTLTGTTNASGETTLRYTPETAGTLRLVAEIEDASGRVARSATYLWVSGGQFASWRVSNDDTLELIADKEEYEVGDTAEILVPAPFEGAIGLVTVERGKVIEREVRDFPTNSERLEIDIEDIAVPNVFVGVVLYRPPTAEDPVARYKVGYVELKVSTDVRLLNVEITPNVDQAVPGETVRYDIKVTDSNGDGVRSEVSVAVVDKAVLSLAQERGPTGLAAFWYERGLGVTTASSLSVSVDRSNDVISEAAAGGKGGGGFDDPRLRQDFRNTAYWEAQLVTDDDGKASVDVVMPDNLTTWRMQVRAVSGDILVGEATNELVSTQPLLLRPALPRFLRVGDEVTLRTLVRNATQQARDVRVTLAADGVNVTGALEQTVRVAPGASEEVTWPASVSREGTASIQITARTDGGPEDAVLQEIPVYLDVTPETTATGGVVTDQPVQEVVYIPSYTIQEEGLGSLYVGVQASLIGALSKELTFYRPYPRDSVDRRAERVIATLAALEADPNASLPYSEDTLRNDMAEIISLQRGDGGWPWCRQCPGSDVQVTAWVLQALGAWQRAGNDVDASVLNRAADYVYSKIQGFSDVANPTDPSFKAYLLYSLSTGGRPDLTVSTMRSLVQQDRANLTNWARAYLLLGFANADLDKDDVEVQMLLNDLAVSVIPSANGNHWEDAPKYQFAQSGPRTTALVLQALAEVDPNHPLIEETARWLVVALSTNVCETGLEKAQAIVSLSRYVVETGERGAEYEFNVALGSETLLDGDLTSTGDVQLESVELPITELTAGQPSLVALTRDFDRPGRMYYTMNLRYVTPAQDIEALNRGFAVSHEYSLLEDEDTRITSASLGDVVRVRITVMVPADSNYVVVEDFLPAGLEPIDPSLAIVEPALRAQLQQELEAANRPDDLQYYAPWFRWYYNPWQQTDLLDDRVRLSTSALAKGVYEFVYYARATTPGDFFVAPVHVETSYFPEVFGRSDSGRFTVEP